MQVRRLQNQDSSPPQLWISPHLTSRAIVAIPWKSCQRRGSDNKMCVSFITSGLFLLKQCFDDERLLCPSESCENYSLLRGYGVRFLPVSYLWRPDARLHCRSFITRGVQRFDFNNPGSNNLHLPNKVNLYNPVKITVTLGLTRNTTYADRQQGSERKFAHHRIRFVFVS